MSDAPQIYVACLAAYNNGHLHGRWVEANQDADAIHEQIQAMLAESPVPGAEEWAIHDFENFHGLTIGEHDSVDDVAKLADLLEEHGDAYAAYVDCVGAHYATPEGFEEHYRGEWDSAEAYAENLIDEGCFGEIPQAIANYIDVEKIAHDLEMGGDCSFIERGRRVYVFDNH